MPQRCRVATLLAPTHVVEVADIPRKGQHPERRQQRGERAHDRHPSEVASTEAHQQHRKQRHERKKCCKQVEEPGQSQEHRGRAAVSAIVQSPRREPDEQQRDRQRKAVRELTGHRRHQIPAIDVVRAVEDERQGHQRQQRGPWECQTSQTTRDIGTGRKSNDSADHHQLHGNSVRNRND